MRRWCCFCTLIYQSFICKSMLPQMIKKRFFLKSDCFLVYFGTKKVALIFFSNSIEFESVLILLHMYWFMFASSDKIRRKNTRIKLKRKCKKKNKCLHQTDQELNKLILPKINLQRIVVVVDGSSYLIEIVVLIFHQLLGLIRMACEGRSIKT